MTYPLASRSLHDLLHLRSMAYSQLAPQVKPSGSNKTQVLEDLFDLLTPAGLKQFCDLLSPTETALLKASLDPGREALLPSTQLELLAEGSTSLLSLVMNPQGRLAEEFKLLLSGILLQDSAASQLAEDDRQLSVQTPQVNMHYVDSAEVIDCGSVQLADCLAGHPVLASLCLRAGTQWLVVLHREMAAFRIQLQKLGYFLPVIRG